MSVVVRASEGFDARAYETGRRDVAKRYASTDDAILSELRARSRGHVFETVESVHDLVFTSTPDAPFINEDDFVQRYGEDSTVLSMETFDAWAELGVFARMPNVISLNFYRVNRGTLHIPFSEHIGAVFVNESPALQNIEFDPNHRMLTIHLQNTGIRELSQTMLSVQQIRHLFLMENESLVSCDILTRENFPQLDNVRIIGNTSLDATNVAREFENADHVFIVNNLD